ncbi:hypothetical protein CEXT_117381 [Caerostris extrusa]|uniref:Uncharacterized protein n=1 Tax=Caerostris extrusa TaxID=172846 RepID=A0AAV4XAL7_CAEEX|nr:hypothetical protein CEXT_117381 [Caerostris extrusa]
MLDPTPTTPKLNSVSRDARLFVKVEKPKSSYCNAIDLWFDIEDSTSCNLTTRHLNLNSRDSLIALQTRSKIAAEAISDQHSQLAERQLLSVCPNTSAVSRATLDQIFDELGVEGDGCTPPSLSTPGRGLIGDIRLGQTCDHPHLRLVRIALSDGDILQKAAS